MSKILTNEQIWGESLAADLTSEGLVEAVEKLRKDLELALEVEENGSEETHGSQSEQEEFSTRDQGS